MLFKKSFGDLVWLSFSNFGGATRIPAEDWRRKKDKSRTKHENRITWLLGTLETSTLEFWSVASLFSEVFWHFPFSVTWMGFGLGFGIWGSFCPQRRHTSMPCNQILQSQSKFVMTWPLLWFSHHCCHLILWLHHRGPFQCPPWNMSSRCNGLNSLSQGLYLQV